jgi:pimeloyl-ACP methyl ester carboxylesterase
LKTSLVLIPGLLCDEQAWEHQIEHLSDLIDPLVPDLSNADTPEAMVDAILRICPENFLLAGHSMGGWLALEIMKRYPHRVKKLCLLATTADLDSAERKTGRETMMEQTRQGHFAQVVQDLTDAFTHQTTAKDDVHAMLLRNKNAFFNQQNALLARASAISVLGQIHMPTLVIVGREDHLFLESTIKIAQGIPHSQFTMIENCGHMLTMEMPDAVSTQMTRWVDMPV